MAHLDTATAGPRTVPVRSGIAGGKAQECSRPPRPSDVLRAGTARAPVGFRVGQSKSHRDSAQIPDEIALLNACEKNHKFTCLAFFD